MKKTSPIYILIFITVLSVVFGFGISFVNYATEGLLKKNEALHRNRVIATAFMLPVTGRTAGDYEAAVRGSIESFSLAVDGKTIQAFRNKTTGEVGFVFAGPGFWDQIRGLMVLTPDLSRVKNIAILEQKETPGLGARIEEPGFLNSFQGIEPAWDSSRGEFIIIGPSPNPSARNRIDAITGATQTSLAFMKAINADLAAFKKAYVPGKGTRHE